MKARSNLVGKTVVKRLVSECLFSYSRNTLIRFYFSVNSGTVVSRVGEVRRRVQRIRLLYHYTYRVNSDTSLSKTEPIEKDENDIQNLKPQTENVKPQILKSLTRLIKLNFALD